MSSVWEEIRFFVSSLASLSVSESIALGRRGLCVSTGTYSESWIYYPEKITSPEIVHEAVNFFLERDISFMWPLYDDGDRKLLENAGLCYAGDLTAMSLTPRIAAPNNNVTFERVNDSLLWARTAWQGFGGSVDELPGEFVKFSGALNADRENFSLYLARYEGEEAGTFLVTNEEKCAGVYYFAVMPELRRKGIARAMMNEICRLSGGKSGGNKKKILLQATPMGVPFYRAYGFDIISKIPVYSTEEDIF